MIVGASDRGSLQLDTRKRINIDNFFDRRPLTDGELAYCSSLKDKHGQALHRPTQACCTYNCHGLTFAARRTGIADGLMVSRILAHDEYQKVDRKSVLPGDIAVYRSIDTNEPEHSGIVMTTDFPITGPKILSKWGTCHEVIHTLYDCPYDARAVTFHRITR